MTTMTTETGARPATAITAGPVAEPGDRPAASGRTWTLTTTNGFTAVGHLPAWAEEDPSAAGVRLDRLSARLADITHRAPFDGLCLPVVEGSGPAQKAEILSGGIECVPYAEAPDPNVPVVNLRIVDDHWITGLDPAALTDFAAALRAHADHLDHHVHPALTAARTDWTTHHPPRPTA